MLLFLFVLSLFGCELYSQPVVVMPLYVSETLMYRSSAIAVEGEIIKPLFYIVNPDMKPYRHLFKPYLG